jgi:hypothetical protein
MDHVRQAYGSRPRRGRDESWRKWELDRRRDWRRQMRCKGNGLRLTAERSGSDRQ